MMRKNKYSYLILILLLTGCGYSKPKVSTDIIGGIILDKSRFLVIVYQEKYRSPEGIRTFPNGGVRLVEAQKYLLYLCNRHTKKCQHTGEISRQDMIRRGLLESRFHIARANFSTLGLRVLQYPVRQVAFDIETPIISGYKKWTILHDPFAKKTDITSKPVPYPAQSLKIDFGYKLSFYRDSIKVASSKEDDKHYRTLMILDHSKTMPIPPQ